MRKLGALLLALVVLSGCGQSDEEKAESTAVEFADAAGSGDDKTVCSLLTASARKEMPSGCSDLVKTLGPAMKSREAIRVELIGSKANVDLGRPKNRTIVIGLVRTDDDWKVADLSDKE